MLHGSLLCCRMRLLFHHRLSTLLKRCWCQDRGGWSRSGKTVFVKGLTVEHATSLQLGPLRDAVKIYMKLLCAKQVEILCRLMFSMASMCCVQHFAHARSCAGIMNRNKCFGGYLLMVCPQQHECACSRTRACVVSSALILCNIFGIVQLHSLQVR